MYYHIAHAHITFISHSFFNCLFRFSDVFVSCDIKLKNFNIARFLKQAFGALSTCK